MKASHALCAILAACLLSSCSDREPVESDKGVRTVKATAWTNFSGDRAMADVKAIVNLGPRPSGSQGIEASRQYIEKKLKEAGWESKRQEFEADTVLRGKIKMVNVIARFTVPGTDAWSRKVMAAVCSHYDTKWFQSTRFVGANDGGSSTGLLLEVARASAPVKDFAAKLELVFFDGEEAVSEFTEARGFNDTRFDGLYGSRYYAKQLRTVPAGHCPKYGVVFDMIGDDKLEVELPVNASARLNGFAQQAAAELGFANHFSLGEIVIDDHVPLSWLGMEVIDFIDLNSYRDKNYWHTSADTFDKLNPESIEIAGRTGLLMLEKYLSE
ncbi:MAG TPA: M28 family peptidase [Verrucomicrobiales bacterium]|nr:M28 family peptidase [Verrucomicrobiales bacterium]